MRREDLRMSRAASARITLFVFFRVVVFPTGRTVVEGFLVLVIGIAEEILVGFDDLDRVLACGTDLTAGLRQGSSFNGSRP
jgi:hypothetical protein